MFVIINLTQLSEKLQKSKVTLWRWTKNGVLPKPIKVNGQIVGWKKEDIENWLDGKEPKK